MDQDHRTEAACLLEQGAKYRRRIGLEPAAPGGIPIFAGFKRAGFSLYFGDSPIYHFDGEGRWQRAFAEGTHYLKGLDGVVSAIDRVREGANLVLRRRTLDDAEAEDRDAQVRSVASRLIADLDTGQLGRREPPAGRAQPLENDELREFLDRISRWDGAAWLAHRARFRATYGPLPFLPPECQNAVVLQATLGHSQGQAFGRAPAGAHRVRSPVGFAEHATAVAVLWGRRLLQSRLLFLAGSDVLRLPSDEVSAYLEIMGQTFPIQAGDGPNPAPGRDLDDPAPRFEGIHAFLDDLAPPCPDPTAWAEWAARGLVRVSIGIESGAPEVRAAYHKHWDDDALRATIIDLKEAGLGVSLLTFVAAGGLERAGLHLHRTVALIESLGLGRGDFVFLLDEQELREFPVPVPPRPSTSFEDAARVDSQRRLEADLAPLRGRGIKVLPYTLEKQWT